MFWTLSDVNRPTVEHISCVTNCSTVLKVFESKNKKISTVWSTTFEQRSEVQLTLGAQMWASELCCKVGEAASCWRTALVHWLRDTDACEGGGLSLRGEGGAIPGLNLLILNDGEAEQQSRTHGTAAALRLTELKQIDAKLKSATLLSLLSVSAIPAVHSAQSVIGRGFYQRWEKQTKQLELMSWMPPDKSLLIVCFCINMTKT